MSGTPGAAGRILVVGTERSGTTWIGRTLAAGEGCSYVHEPDNPDATPAAEHAEGHLGLYPVLLPGERHASYEADWDLAFAGGWPRNRLTVAAGRSLRRLPRTARKPVVHAGTALLRKLRPRPPVVVVKSVHSMFCLRWLADRYRPQVVVVRRNPLATVASLVTLGTTDSHLEKLYRLYADPVVGREVVGRLGLPPPPRSLGLVEKCAWWVGLEDAALVSAVLPGWRVVVHEDLCRDPAGRFADLFAALGLQWGPAVPRFLAASDREGSGFSTNRLTRTAPERWRGLLGETESAARRILEHFPAGDLLPRVAEGVSAGAS
jgi:hypothetical protein